VGPHPVAVAVDVQDDASVQQPVEHGGGDHRVVVEYLSPANRGWHMFGLSNLGWYLGCLLPGVSADL
jgi:hypothetical protein